MQSKPVKSYPLWGTHKTVFGSFWDKIALNRQLLRWKGYYYWKLLGQENRQLHKEVYPTVKLKAIIRRNLNEVMLVQLVVKIMDKIMDREIVFEKKIIRIPVSLYLNAIRVTLPKSWIGPREWNRLSIAKYLRLDPSQIWARFLIIFESQK